MLVPDKFRKTICIYTTTKVQKKRKKKRSRTLMVNYSKFVINFEFVKLEQKKPSNAVNLEVYLMKTGALWNCSRIFFFFFLLVHRLSSPNQRHRRDHDLFLFFFSVLTSTTRTEGKKRKKKKTIEWNKVFQLIECVYFGRRLSGVCVGLFFFFSCI